MLPPQLQRKLAGTQEQLEQYRLQLLANRRQELRKIGLVACACACVAVAIAIGLAAGFVTANEIAIVMIVLASAGIFGALFYAASHASAFSDAYAGAYKTEINNAIVRHFSPALSYNEEDGIDSDVFESSHLFSAAPDRYATGDLVSGAYGKTQLKFARVHAEQKRSSDESTYYETIFEGVLMIADFNKKFRGHTYVRTDIAESALGHFGRTLQKLSVALSSDQLVQLENPEFEKEFAVYTSDQVEARYILSPALMERMLELIRRTGTEIQFSFSNSSVIISIAHAKELFAPDFARPATDAAQLGEVYDQLAFFVGIIDDLDLNTRLWSKE